MRSVPEELWSMFSAAAGKPWGRSHVSVGIMTKSSSPLPTNPGYNTEDVRCLAYIFSRYTLHKQIYVRVNQRVGQGGALWGSCVELIFTLLRLILCIEMYLLHLFICVLSGINTYYLVLTNLLGYYLPTHLLLLLSTVSSFLTILILLVQSV